MWCHKDYKNPNLQEIYAWMGYSSIFGQPHVTSCRLNNFPQSIEWIEIVGAAMTIEVRVLDDMVDYAVEQIVGEPFRKLPDIVLELATMWPNTPALALCFALTSAAASVEGMVGHQDRTGLAYKCAALVAADILAIEAMGQRPARSMHLVNFWRRTSNGFWGG